MKHDQNIRWGMIGVGSVAETKSGPAFLQAAGGTLVAVASRTPESAQAFALRHQVPHSFNTPNDLIHCELVDAVYIATPPASHFPLALEVARAGKPCVIEKPMTVYLSDAIELCRVFDAKNIPLFVAYYRRSLHRFNAIKRAIDEKVIGNVTSVEWVLSRTNSAKAEPGNWRMSLLDAPGGLFEDLACHGLDLFDYYFGPITKIHKSELGFSDDIAVPTRVEASWSHSGEVTGHGKWDFNANAHMDRVTVLGIEGKMSFSVFDDEPILTIRGGETTSFSVSNPMPIQLPHVVALNRALHENVAHPSSGHSAMRTSWASEEILRGFFSAVEGRH